MNSILSFAQAHAITDIKEVDQRIRAIISNPLDLVADPAPLRTSQAELEAALAHRAKLVQAFEDATMERIL